MQRGVKDGGGSGTDEGRSARLRGGATMALEMLNAPLRAVEAAGPDVAMRVMGQGAERMQDAGLDAADLAKPYARIPHDTALGLLRDVTEAVNEPGFALRAGQGNQPGDFGVFDFATRTAATLRDAIVATCRYLPLLHDGAECHLEIDGDWALLRHRLLPGLESSAGANEYVIASFVFSTARYLGMDYPPHEVHFTHAAPDYLDVYGQVFRTTLRFGCGFNAIVFPVAGLQLPMCTADAPLHLAMCRYADQLLALVPRRSTVGMRVKDLLAEHLERGALSLSDLARRMQTTPRTLRRKLSDEGSTHKQLVEDVRRERALVLLADPNEDLSQIAYRLGYAQAPAFHRAFKRWYGIGPSTYRKRHAGTRASRFYAGLSE